MPNRIGRRPRPSVFGERASNHQTQTQPFDGAAVERLIVRLPDRYAAVRLLGHGGQGMVWLADDHELGEQVAIKILNRLDAVAAERVRREVRLCRRLRHANLAEIYELIEAGDTLAVVMEHLPGGSLADRLRSGPLPIADVAAIARSLLAGLAHLHGASIVHRDVKPSNVLFAADGTPKLADFGLLRTLDGDQGLTRTGLTVGTPAYMSPEQIRGEELTAASDLYSLGVTLYELLVGRQPFVAVSGLEVAHLHLSRVPNRVRAHRPECPRWLAAFVERLLAKDPRGRWRDAALALAAFDRRRPGLSRRTRRSLAGGAAVAAALAALAVGVPRLVTPDVIDARVEGGTLVARNASGRELWRVTPAAIAVFAATGDVLPARGREVVTAEVTEAAGVESTELVVRDRRGAELRREPIGHLAAGKWFPQLSDSYRTAMAPLLVDANGDGLDEVLVALAHWPFYPSLVMLWQPASSVPSRAVLANSGHIADIWVTDLDADGAPELIASGLNNILGMQNIVAVVDLDGFARDSREWGATSPDLMPLTASGAGAMPGVRSYTMLGEARGAAAIDAAGAGGITLRIGTAAIRLDPDGNPEGSPLWHRGTEARRRFWEDCRDTQLRTADDPGRAPSVTAAFESRQAAVLAETATRDAAFILLARSLADAGHPAAGAGLLGFVERGPTTNRRVWRQRGELLLIAGRRGDARDFLDRAIAAQEHGANPLDELLLLALDAAANGDDSLYARVVRLWQGATAGWTSAEIVSLRPVRAFLDGAWEDARPVGQAWHDSLFHWQALTAWASLESGAPATAVLGALQPITDRPEARELCVLVRGRAAMLGGDPRAAADLAHQALLGFEHRAHRSYEEFIWQGLAHWLRGAALQDAGDPAAARANLEIAATRLPGSWFGRDAQRRLSHSVPTPAAGG
jgi:hypothetical protein